MTFEEWFEEVSPDKKYNMAHIGWEDIYNFMEQAWNAAKNDKELIAYVKYSKDVKDWYVCDEHNAIYEDLFESETEAKQWALQNGYRVVE